MKVSPFMANYSRELRMGADIREKEKIEKTTEFAERIKKSTGESWYSIKESIQEDEAIDRQQEKKLKNRKRKIE